MTFLYRGRDIAIFILREVYRQDYRTASTNRIARCVRAELVFKYPTYLLTDMFSIYLHLLKKVGLFTTGEFWKYLELLREKRRQIFDISALSDHYVPEEWRGHGVLVERRKAFEANTMHEAKRRRLECLYGTPVELIREKKEKEKVNAVR